MVGDIVALLVWGTILCTSVSGTTVQSSRREQDRLMMETQFITRG